MWLLPSGQKFPAKTMEVSLQATIQFPDHFAPPSGVDQEDPFCVGLNTYADVSPLQCWVYFEYGGFSLSLP